MPAAYTHNRFGSDCIRTLPVKLQTLCEDCRSLYDFGVHGPDILFYNHPLWKNRVNRTGVAMHHRSGREFFEACRTVYQSCPGKPAMTVYLLGFLAHFTLDSCCHGYINEQTEALGLSHNFIEAQYEAFLMEMDDRDPLLVDRSETLIPSKASARIIARFFDLTEHEILRALLGQCGTMKLFYSPSERKKKILRTLIRTLKIGGDFGDLFIDREPHPKCFETSEEIFKMQEEALDLYPSLAQNLLRFLQGKEELCDFFDRDFEGNAPAPKGVQQ